MGPEMNHVGEKPFDPLTLVVYPDAKGEATARVYEDDGATQRYRQGVFRRTSVSATRSGGEMQIKISAPEGSYNPGARAVTLIVKSVLRAAAVSLDGRALAALTSGARGAGWAQSGDDLLIQIADDGMAHTIQVRPAR
jgi:hypothetical protein